MVLDGIGNPLARKSDEANPYLWDSLLNACKFAEGEKKNQDGVAIARIRVIDKQGSGM